MTVLAILDEQKRTLESRLAEIRVELARVHAARMAVMSLDDIEGLKDAPKRTRKPRTGTLKEWVLKILSHHPGGCEKEAIIQEIAVMGGPDIAKSSMGPALSRMKNEGVVLLHGKRWRLPTIES